MEVHEEVAGPDGTGDVAMETLKTLRELQRILSILAVAEPARSAGARQAVIELVKRRPDVFRPSELAEQLAGRIYSKSGEPRKVLQSTVSTLLRERVLAKSAAGKLIPAEAEELAYAGTTSPAQ